MPAWLVTLLIQSVLPAILQAAYKSGMINLVEEQLIKFGMSLKTYHETTDFPDAPKEKTNDANFTVGRKEDNQRRAK